MPMNQLLMHPKRSGLVYDLRDDFTDTLAAGSVNGTPATPGPGTRAVTDTDGDGIGDTPYIINEDNQDNYPLMNPVATVIPEFPSWASLMIMLIVVLVVAVIYRRVLSKPNEGRMDRCRSGSGACRNLSNCILQKTRSGEHQ